MGGYWWYVDAIAEVGMLERTDWGLGEGERVSSTLDHELSVQARNSGTEFLKAAEPMWSLGDPSGEK